MQTRGGWGRLLALALAVPALARAATDFEAWMKQDQALQRDADAVLEVGDFRVTLPLGWVREAAGAEAGGDVRLRYVGPRGDGAPPEPRAALRAEPAASAEGELARAGGWPSPFSGWTAFRPGRLWALRAQVPEARAGLARVAVQVPASTASLVIEFDLPAGGDALPECATALLAAVTYAGEGAPLAPPDAPRSGNTYRAPSARLARAPAEPLAAASPLQAAAVAAVRAMQAGADPATANQVAILDRGDLALLARIHLIRSAARSIKIQTFIWSNDETGRLFMYELLQAARRGVKVQVLADHMASMRDVDLVAFLATASPNVELRHYRPAAGRLDPNIVLEALDYLIPNDTNQRMHNKLFLVDDAVFITGGRNIGNEYYNQGPRLNYRDRDVLVAGPMAAYAAGSFDEYWGYEEAVPSAKLKDVARAIHEDKFPRLEARADFRLGDGFADLERDLADGALLRQRLAEPLRPVAQALFLADPPGKAARYYTAWRRGTIARQIEAVMREARQSLVCQTPYLVLDGGMIRLFRDMKKARPDLRIVFSSNSYGSTDNTPTYAANFKLRSAYVKEAGLTVFEFRPQPAERSDLLPNRDALAQRAPPADRSEEAARDEPPRSARGDGPFLCVHAKSFVVDSRLGFVGSYNFDPRSIAWNTEVGLMVDDAAFARQLRDLILRDVEPENSWIIAKRETPLEEAHVLRQVDARSVARARLDLWPARWTTSFEKREGVQAVLPEHPRFYANYADAGVFPGADEGLSFKDILTHLLTTLSGLAMPLL